MNQPYKNKTGKAGGKPPVQRPIRRTLVVTLGSLAGAAMDHLPVAFTDETALAGIVALINVDAPHDDLAAAIRDRLAGISRAGNQDQLAANGYVMDRMKELALFVIVDATDRKLAGAAAAIMDLVAAIAQEGWGLETHTIAIVLADDWTEETPKSSLRALLETAPESLASLLPLNRINELGLELDTREAYLARAASIVEALIATPLRDAPRWILGLQDSTQVLPTLTTVGLACWTWEPEGARDTLAQAWREQVINHWLAPAAPEQAGPASQQASGWFTSQGLLAHALVAMLERSVPAYPVPRWQLPYPWRAAEAIDRLHSLSDALAAGRGGAVELLLHDQDEWPAAQEQALRTELAAQLDREPLAGFDLAERFLRELMTLADDAADMAGIRRDELEEQAADQATRLGDVMGRIETIFRGWPPDDPVAWALMLLRPWRWLGLARDYWVLHGLAHEAEQLVARQAAIEREHELAAAADALYQRLAAVFRRVECHLDEVRNMLRSRHSEPGVVLAPDLEKFIVRTLAQGSSEPAAVSVACELGGLGRLVHEMDEGVLADLTELGRQRYRFLIDTPAVDMLPQLYEDEAARVGWWQALWVGATPLWLYDDARQPEESRLEALSGTTVCAAGAERLRHTLGLSDLPDWRWLPMDDGRRIIVMRWRTGVALQQ